MMADIGVVVIGRNEGERLRRALSSAIGGDHPVVYVDSGSSDGSVELARSLGVAVHELDPATPFSAARARAEGVTELLREFQDVRFLQFLDGDCELNSGWLSRAASLLDERPEVAVVCGHLSERPSEVPLYSKISPQTWKQPTGEIAACGGIFMIRRDIYEAVGGFNAALLTREESDLCVRVRCKGGRVVRLDSPMAEHDSGITNFGQWWARAIWGGYGDALSIRCSSANRGRLRRFWAGELIPPALIIVGASGLIWSNWFLLALMLGVIGLGCQFAKTAFARWRQGDAPLDAILFSSFSSLRSFAGGIGFLRFYLQQGRPTKRPDPRTPMKRQVVGTPSE